MTFMEATFELKSPLSADQMRHMGAFANTYGLRRFRVNESKRLLTFEYDASRLKESQVAQMPQHMSDLILFDASRLKESQVAHVLGHLRIRVLRRVDPFAVAGLTA
jgi:hypothetical protein